MRKRWSPAFEQAPPCVQRSLQPSARRVFATPEATENLPREPRPLSHPAWRSLAGPLTIAFGLVGIDLAHAFEKFFDVRLVHFGRTGAFASAAGCGTCWSSF